MAFTDAGKNHLLSLLLGSSTETLAYGGFGVDDYSLVSDTLIQGSVVVADACDATTGWSLGGVASAMTVNSTNFQEGTGSLNLGKTSAATDAHYYKTVTSMNLSGSNDKFYAFFYVNDVTLLDDVTNAVYIQLGTGGFTNANQYDFARANLSSGWNGLILNVVSATSVLGSGAVSSNIDRVKFGMTGTNAITVGDAKIDYFRGVVDGGRGIPDSKHAPSQVVSDKSVQLTYTALSTESNGYDISSAGLSTSTVLLTKSNFAAINKDENFEVQSNEYIAIK